MAARLSLKDKLAALRKAHGCRQRQEPPGDVESGVLLRLSDFSQARPDGSLPTEAKRVSAKTTAVKGQEEAAPFEHSYWPIVRQYIENGGHAGHTRRIRAVCPICSDELTIHGIDPAKDRLIDQAFYSIGDEMPAFTRCATIPCGHLFCPDCLDRAFEADREMHRRRACPVCRLKVDCGQCGRMGPVVHLPDRKSVV